MFTEQTGGGERMLWREDTRQARDEIIYNMCRELLSFSFCCISVHFIPFTLERCLSSLLSDFAFTSMYSWE